VARSGLLWSAIWFVAGIACELCGLRVALSSSTVAIVIALWPRARFGRIRLLAGIAFGLGTIDAAVFGSPQALVADAHYQRFVVTVADERQLDAGSASLTVRMPDGALALLDMFGKPPAVGERLLIRAKRDVFDEARNPGEPSERELEAERGIVWHLRGGEILARASPDERDASLWIPRVRAWASRRLHETIAEPGATILAGAMWGERGALSPELRNEFQDTGTVHVLVTAGLHLGVVAALSLGLLRALACGRVAASLATIAIVWTYAAFSGDHLPSLRAATMLTFGLLAHAAGREALSWNALAAAAIAIAAFDPVAVTTVSFALSFSCVAAILGFARPFAHGLVHLGLPKLVSELAAVSLATQLGTWPLTAATFLVIAPYAPIANLAVVPIVGVVMLAGFVSLLAAPIPIISSAAANVATSLLDWIVACVRCVSGLPGAHIIATPPPPWSIALYDASVVATAVAFARRRYVAIASVSIAIASALCLWPPRTISHDLTVAAIDVGQADAILIRTPSGHAYLVDAGGRLERGSATSGNSVSEAIGERIVVPFLIRQGIHHLDAVLLSHPHGDHAGGIEPVLRTLGANGFADSGQTYPGHAYHDALDIANATHVPMLEPRGGDVWRTDDGVTFRFYGPTCPYITGSRSDINSNSLVFRLEYGRFAMLFMGDAGTETEARLLASGDDMRADVLKVGHHGSSYGTTPAFVRAVEPRYAIVSVGRHNLFGHPALQTLETLGRAGAAVYRTDEDGAVTLRTDGATVTIATMLRQ
jgi:competence protein ComEC